MSPEEAECQLCGSRDSEFLFQTPGVDIFSDKLYTLKRCNSCGLVYLNSSVIKVDFREIDRKEFYTFKKNRALGYQIFRFLTEIFMALKAKRVCSWKNRGTILDVGCGEGAFLEKMAQRNWSCYGLDLSAYALQAASSKEKIEFFQADILDVNLPAAYFDLITFWQSFEHMTLPNEVLKKTHFLLKNDGFLFISVPNVRSFEARMSLKDWFGLQVPRHYYMYSPRTLTRLLEKNDFVVVSMTQNSLQYNFAIVVQSLCNFLGGEHNLLYNFFRRQIIPGANLFWRFYTIFLIVAIFPLAMFLTAGMYAVNLVLDNGSVIEIFARRAGKNG